MKRNVKTFGKRYCDSGIQTEVSLPLSKIMYVLFDTYKNA